MSEGSSRPPIVVRDEKAANLIMSSIEKGAQKKCDEGDAVACLRLARYYQTRDKAKAASQYVSCCEKTKHSACCWESALLHSNSFPKTGIQRSFETSIRNFMDACTYNKTNDYDVIDSKGKSCHALAEIILREKTRKEFDSNYQSLPILNELMSKMNMKNLLMQSCQMRNWDACNMYAVLAFEGQHGVKKDPELGIALAEKSCTIGRDVKACNNLIRIYKEGLFGRDIDEDKAGSYQSVIDSVMDEREAFMMNK